MPSATGSAPKVPASAAGPARPPTRQPDADGAGVGTAVGVGHGTVPPGPPMRQADADGAGVGRGVAVGHGATTPPVPTRHDGLGVGVGATTAALLELPAGLPAAPPPGTGELPP